MAPFRPHFRFELRDDGLVYSSSGTQSNCAGIARILTRIEPIDPSRPVELVAHDETAWNGDPDDGRDVPAARIASEFRLAAFLGAKEAFDAFGVSRGFRLTFVSALMHPVDSREVHFYRCGRWSTEAWLVHQGFAPLEAIDGS